MLRILFEPSGGCARATLVGTRFRSLGFRFSVETPERMFWQLLPAPALGSQVCRLFPFSTEEWMGQGRI